MNDDLKNKLLTKRFDKNYLKKRLNREKLHSALQFRGGFKVFWENLDWLAPYLHFFLKKFGLLRLGLKNTLQYQIVKREISFPNLPSAFHQYTILQISDLHMDGIYDHGKKFIQLLNNLRYDLCVITGDFRFLTYGQVHDAMVYTQKAIDALNKNIPIVGILGNHDSIEMIPFLEDFGVKMLVNESMILKKGGDQIGIAGVDDAHFYETENLTKAMEGLENCSFKLLLAHSQELIPAAQKQSIDFYLCGHTHGGQICLPGGFAAIKNTPYGNLYFKGHWKYKTMEGYTSRGVGASCLPVRFNCPPEITLHTLLKST